MLSLYSYDRNPDDTSVENLVRQSIELTGRIPVIVANAYAVKKHYYDGESLYIHVPDENLSVAENFLYILRPDKQFTELEAHILDMMLILHAEHGGGNNSAFTCRVLSSTGTDTYGAISGAVNSLKGPLHGGANTKVMEMFHGIRDHIHDPADEEEVYHYLKKILDRQAAALAGMVGGLAARMERPDFPLACMGGLLTHVPEYRARFVRELHRKYPQIQIAAPQGDAAQGALVQAERLACSEIC